MAGSGDIIQIDAARFEQAVKSMTAAADKLDDTLAVAAEMLAVEVHDRWMSAGDGSWPALAPSTIAKRRGSVSQILVDTGRAIGSVRGDHGPDFAEAASDVDYLKYHCGDGARTRIPKRDPFEIKDDAVNRITEFILADLVVRWAETGSTG